MSSENKFPAKYQKLFKIPPEAVRYKMISDNMSDKIIGLIFGCEIKSESNELNFFLKITSKKN